MLFFEKGHALRPTSRNVSDVGETKLVCNGVEHLDEGRFAKHIAYASLHRRRLHIANVGIYFVLSVNRKIDCRSVYRQKLVVIEIVALFEKIRYVVVYDSALSVKAHGNFFGDHRNELCRNADEKTFGARVRFLHGFEQNGFCDLHRFLLVKPLAVFITLVLLFDDRLNAENALRPLCAHDCADKARVDVQNGYVFCENRTHILPLFF